MSKNSHFFCHFRDFGHIFKYECHMYIIAYEHSYDIIGQKFSIRQKFLPPRAPLKYLKNEKKPKKIAHFSLTFVSFSKCCRFEARGVAEISDRSTNFGLCC